MKLTGKALIEIIKHYEEFRPVYKKNNWTPEQIVNAQIVTGAFKNLIVPNVSQRNELLAFAEEMQNIGFSEMDDAAKVVDIYMKNMSKEIKYPKDTKVIVCNVLETIIEKVELVERSNEYKYWFRDENGKLRNETKEAIEKANEIYNKRHD